MRKVILACAGLVQLLLPVNANAADEITAFRLTDFRAYLELKYRNDLIDNVATGVETEVDDTRRQIELGASTTSYVFHPKLLRMLIAGSVLSDQQTIDRERISPTQPGAILSSNFRDEVLLNLDANLQFLKDKPYPTTLSYIRTNPIVRTGVEGSFTQESERYGVDFQLRDVLPVDMSVNAFQDSSFGESLDRVIDFTSESVTVTARKNFSSGDRLSVEYENSRQVSRNGDPRRVIQETIRQAQRVAVSSTSRLGANDQLRIDQTATINRRDEPDVTDINFVPQVRWIHSDSLQTRYRYSFSQTERPQSDFRNRTEALSASLHYSPSDEVNGFIRSDFDRSTEDNRLSQDSQGLSGRANLRRYTSNGQLNISLGIGYRNNSRESHVPSIVVLEELLTFSGTAPIGLARDFVITETIVVRNETRTQTYIEGLDYRLIQIGSVTQIERLLGGSILQDESVLIDYEAETGGTFDYKQENTTFSADYKFAEYHNIFFRYLNNRQDLTSGVSTLPFNSIEAIEVGLREQLPLRLGGIRLFGEARYRRQNEDINPFDQRSLLVSVEAPLPFRMNFSASASRNIVENHFSDEDQDLDIITANLIWQARRNLSIRAEAYYDEDTGGTVLRSNSRLKFGVQWRYRRVSLRLDARHEEQEQGDFTSDHFELWLQIRRELF
jgi:hypothetical protein